MDMNLPPPYPPPVTSGDHARLIRLWSKAEDVAMHFNELILNFRVRALGAVTVGAGLFGSILLTRDAPAPRVNYFIFAGAMFFLAVIWASLVAIDHGYYVRLLRGAVIEAIRLEQASPGTIRLSHAIEGAIIGDEHFDPSKRGTVPIGFGTTVFYVVPLSAFVVAAVMALVAVPPAASSQPVEPQRSGAARPATAATGTPPAMPPASGTPDKKPLPPAAKKP